MVIKTHLFLFLAFLLTAVLSFACGVYLVRHQQSAGSGIAAGKRTPQTALPVELASSPTSFVRPTPIAVTRLITVTQVVPVTTTPEPLPSQTITATQLVTVTEWTPATIYTARDARPEQRKGFEKAYVRLQEVVNAQHPCDVCYKNTCRTYNVELQPLFMTVKGNTPFNFNVSIDVPFSRIRLRTPENQLWAFGVFDTDEQEKALSCLLSLPKMPKGYLSTHGKHSKIGPFELIMSAEVLHKKDVYSENDTLSIFVILPRVSIDETPRYIRYDDTPLVRRFPDANP